MTNNILNRHTAPKAEAPERVIQFGEGNFLRAFVDWMIQEMNDKTAFNGSVVIVQPRERNHIETLRAQDCLYHVNLLGLKGNEQVNTCQRISSVSRALLCHLQYHRGRYRFRQHVQAERHTARLLPCQTHAAALSPLFLFQRRH